MELNNALPWLLKRSNTDSAFLYGVLQSVTFSSDAGPVERVKSALFGCQLVAA